MVGLAIAEAVTLGLTMVLARNVWGYAYSNEVEVVKYMAIMMPILASSNFLDSIQCVLSGTKLFNHTSLHIHLFQRPFIAFL